MHPIGITIKTVTVHLEIIVVSSLMCNRVAFDDPVRLTVISFHFAHGTLECVSNTQFQTKLCKYNFN